MIRCKKCGNLREYDGPTCPVCREIISLTDEEIEEKRSEIDEAMSRRDYEFAIEGYRLLADLGDTECERTYASILERGELVDKDLDRAMLYYGRAALKNDPVSAYRYSRLAERHSDRAARFWLAFAAVLGCKEAYPVLADRLSKEGDEERANYFYSLAAVCDDTDSIVTMAKRYYNGIGAEKNEAYAKWYMDKLYLPPIHAIKLAYRLRSVRAEDPGMPRMENYDGFLRSLAAKAQDLSYATAYHRLCTLLSDRGDIEARTVLGMLYAEGLGVKADTDTALELLSSAAAHGNASAYRYMGDLYLAGRAVERNTDKALEYYRHAASLGLNNAYEAMGDVYCEGKLVERDIGEAIRLYDLAAREGVESAKRKSETLKAKREELYSRAGALESVAPEKAFRSYAISTGMGYLPAYLALARCYEEGIGTRRDRARAFMWYLAAEEAGYREATYPLALCYSRGIGVAFNMKRAVALLKKASRCGFPEAKEELVRLLENKKRRLIEKTYSKAMELLFKKKYTEARKYLLVCLKLGHAKGIYTLGCLNEFGIGIPTNRELAFRLYERSFDLKFRDPRAVYKLRVLRMCRDYA